MSVLFDIKDITEIQEKYVDNVMDYLGSSLEMKEKIRLINRENVRLERDIHRHNHLERTSNNISQAISDRVLGNNVSSRRSSTLNIRRRRDFYDINDIRWITY